MVVIQKSVEYTRIWAFGTDPESQIVTQAWKYYKCLLKPKVLILGGVVGRTGDDDSGSFIVRSSLIVVLQNLK
jgi:hypothetical protein